MSPRPGPTQVWLPLPSYLQVVDASLGPHHHLAGWDRLAAAATGAAVSKQPVETETMKEGVPQTETASRPPSPPPDVVAPTQNHASFAVAAGADVAQLGLTAGAPQAARVPVALHGEEQEAVRNPATTARARARRRREAGGLAVYHAAGTAAAWRRDSRDGHCSSGSNRIIWLVLHGCLAASQLKVPLIRILMSMVLLA